MASASNGASAGGYASRPAAVGRQSAPADSSVCVASVPRPRVSQDELSACHAQLLVCVCVCIYIYEEIKREVKRIYLSLPLNLC